MHCLKMGSRWCKWIQPLLKTTRMAILVNRSPTNEFTPSRGIRPGDPLAPYLFLIIREILSRLISKATDRGIFEGIQFKFHDSLITHFQYANDTIVFVQNNDHSFIGLKKILLLFQVVTGLSINFNKSQVFHPSNDCMNVSSGMNILGCQFGIMPFSYLGAWVGQDRKVCSMWSFLKSSMNSKLGGRKCNYLNMAGRIVLLKSCLNSIQTTGLLSTSILRLSAKT